MVYECHVIRKIGYHCIKNMNRATSMCVALVQMQVEVNKTINIKRAAELIDNVTSKWDVKLVALPECFNSPYGTNNFSEHAESIPAGPTSQMLSAAAKRNKLYVVGGTIPEICEEKLLYNTCTVWDPEGNLIAKYRKMHLFDIDIPDKITFKESKVLKPGNELVTFIVDGIKIGLGICYDMRFEEMAKLYRKEDCKLLIYPGSFNMTTGPLHWELLQRSRALDNQCFVCTISPARNTKGYISYGHSGITDPWGVFKSLGREEGVLYHVLDFEECSKVRQNIPIYGQRRMDIYDTIKVTKPVIKVIN